jgi:hypothetical protein
MALGTDAAGPRTARASHHGTSVVTLRCKPEYRVLNPCTDVHPEVVRLDERKARVRNVA